MHVETVFHPATLLSGVGRLEKVLSCVGVLAQARVDGRLSHVQACAADRTAPVLYGFWEIEQDGL